MEPQAAVHLKFLRNYTVEPILSSITREFAARGIYARCSFGSFSDAMSDAFALSEESLPESTIVVVTLSLELYSRDYGHANWACDSACEHLLSLVNAVVERSPRPVIINTVLPPLFPAHGFAVQPGHATQAQRIDELNLDLRRIASDHAGRVVLLDWIGYARELGARDTYDHRFWQSSALPYSSRFLGRFASDIAAVAEVLSGRAKKCLVLDCDNTLWGGVVGEDGPEGIQLAAGTAPGAYFQQFQRSVLDLHKQGVLVALCSKNNEADVLEVLDSHPECLIKREHLAAWRINWNDKASSIAEIADELNIGTDALVFIDDSPQECGRVRDALPLVRVLNRPESVEELPDFLHRNRPFAALVLTEADALRASTFQDNRRRGELASLATDAEDYLRRLETRLRARQATAMDLDRIAQLFQKTNQFNLTTQRYDRKVVERLASDVDSLLYCAEISDRFGDLGLVAAAVARREPDGYRIDSFLMSCRALGRGAEFAFLACLLDEVVRRWGGGAVRAAYVRTAKNGQAADFWSRAGLGPGMPSEDADAAYFHPDVADLVERNRRPHVQEEP